MSGEPAEERPVKGMSRRRSLAVVLGVAVAYFLAGRAALLLAVPPGYATGVWPSAGIALASTILFGHRAALGVALGSFLVNAGPSFTANSMALAASIGIGAALQASGGMLLI